MLLRNYVPQEETISDCLVTDLTGLQDQEGDGMFSMKWKWISTLEIILKEERKSAQ